MRPSVEVRSIYVAAFALAVAGCGAREPALPMAPASGVELRPAPLSTTAPSASALPRRPPKAQLLGRPVTIGVPTPPNGLERSGQPDDSAAEPQPGAMVPGAAGSSVETSGATR
jgi:hypothetical protein